MRQMKFKVLFKIKQYNESFKEEEIIFLESKTHEIYSLCIHGNYVVVPYNNTVLTIFQDECECIDILQFTGLVDRNGKEIYEGDILETKYEDKCEEGGFGIARNGVYFKDGCFGTIGEITREFLPFSDYPIKDEYIIGNIHDNPELLNPQ